MVSESLSRISDELASSITSQNSESCSTGAASGEAVSACVISHPLRRASRHVPIPIRDTAGSLSKFQPWDSPEAVRSSNGDTAMSASGNMAPRRVASSTVPKARPPPAESPARITSGVPPAARSAVTDSRTRAASSIAAGNGCSGVKR
jgi:hypothetical protein